MSAYEDRFRDPGFLAVWQRWQDARNGWRRAWWKAPCPTDPYNPDPTPLHGVVRVAAEEFLAARTAYKALVKEYLDAEGADG